MRAAIIRMNAIAIRVNAAPHALASAPTYGDEAFAKICVDSAVLGPLNRLLFVCSTVRMVNSSGAVSPAARTPEYPAWG